MTMNVPNLIHAAKEGYRTFDEELPELSLYGWAMQYLDHEPSEWDESKVHVSDYRYSLSPEEGGCDRQLMHRFREDERQEASLWRRVMFDQGFAMQIRYSWLISNGLPDGWYLEEVEADVTEGLPGLDVGSCDLVLAYYPDGEAEPSGILGVEMKTQRGKAFQYLDEPKPSHQLQSEGEAYALQRIYPNAEVDHRLMYLDREGQNPPLVFPTDTGAEARERIRKASRYVNDVRRVAESDVEDYPPPLAPEISVRENKGANSVYLEQPWVCAYCDYRPKCCSGALPDHLTNLGIVAKGDHRDGSLDVRVEENEEEVTAAIATAIDAQNVSFK